MSSAAGYPYPQGPRVRGAGAVRCGIAEPSGEPAPPGQKTRYNDGVFEKAFMTLFARKMERFAAPAPQKKKGWWDYDYDSFVDASRRVMQGRSRLQQQQVVRDVLLSMLPPGAPAQVFKSSYLNIYHTFSPFFHLSPFDYIC